MFTYLTSTRIAFFFIVPSTYFYCCFSITTRETYLNIICNIQYTIRTNSNTHTNFLTIETQFHHITYFYGFLWKRWWFFRRWFLSNIMKPNLVYFSFKYYLVFWFYIGRMTYLMKSYGAKVDCNFTGANIRVKTYYRRIVYIGSKNISIKLILYS